MTLTYNDRYADGSKSFGGYSNYIRVPSHFVIRIPETLSSEAAAPLLCAGITVYSSLKQSNAGPSKSIGIVGIGGLGHFGLLFAKVCSRLQIHLESNTYSDCGGTGLCRYLRDQSNTAQNGRRYKDWGHRLHRNQQRSRLGEIAFPDTGHHRFDRIVDRYAD